MLPSAENSFKLAEINKQEVFFLKYFKCKYRYIYIKVHRNSHWKMSWLSLFRKRFMVMIKKVSIEPQKWLSHPKLVMMLTTHILHFKHFNKNYSMKICYRCSAPNEILTTRFKRFKSWFGTNTLNPASHEDANQTWNVTMCSWKLQNKNRDMLTRHIRKKGTEKQRF